MLPYFGKRTKWVACMIVGHKRLRAMRWVLVLAIVVIPLCFLPEWFGDMKIEDLLRKNIIENSLTFTYGEGRTVKCYNENPENQVGVSYVFLPSFADMDRIGVDAEADKVEFAGGKQNITVVRGEHAVCSFEPGTAYQTCFYDAGGEEIGNETIVFLKSENMPTMYVWTRTGSMERLDADKKYKEKASVELLDESGENLFSDDIKNISARGNQTFDYEKKSYQINLKAPVDFMEMGMSDKWILLSNVYDPAYIRNKLTYEMALQAGMPGSPRSEYMDVYFNGNYAGMYQLCEKVEIGENRLEIADLEEQNRALNGEVLDHVEVFVSEDGKKKGFRLAYNPQDITGGYLIEHDYGEKFGEEASGFITEQGEPFVLKNPAHASEAEVAYIGGLMQEIEDAIRAEDGYHPVTGKHYTEYIDLESWADKYLVEEITRNNGGGATSSYFYKPQDGISTKIYGGPVWDYDKGYGNATSFNKNTRDLGLLTLHVANTAWFYYLYQHEEFVDMVKKEYAEKFSGYLSEMADIKADEYLDRIEAAAVPDRARFTHVYRTFGEDALDYRAQAEEVKQFIRERKAFLDEVWLENAEVYMVRFLDESGDIVYCFGVKAGECIEELPVQEGNGRKFLGWRTDTQEFLTSQTPVTEDMTVYAAWE